MFGILSVPVKEGKYPALLRVPGIGVTSARRICAARRQAFLSYDSLRRLGIVLKRAKYFITCRGKYYGGRENPYHIRQKLIQGDRDPAMEQISLF